MLKSDLISVELNTDFFDYKDKYLNSGYDKIIFTGMIDQFFNYKLGELEYRSLRFETEEVGVDNYQGNAVVNYTDSKTPYTRVIEHKHFEFGIGEDNKTIVTREYPQNWDRTKEPYYPINNKKNRELYKIYVNLANSEAKNVIFGGRLGQYRYYNMDKTIMDALNLVSHEFSN
ncbi:UDP-galactopyranose mutase [Apilactobacillus kunkeei]|nr:UDP-galactopyranose mutase [Apilactobacillus kunkeei]CAI2648456.1 UDP-galactopyranose mutase [Apilactobacillus kunkeei]CAI2803176.1 UDP-galactopyranose mutase [Apilactobacillus kunkeei]